MDASVEHHINFTKNVLVGKILEANPDLKKQKLVDVKITSNDELNGFMSNIIFLKLFFEDQSGKKSKEEIIIKLMKGSLETRKILRSDVQFPNEVNIYKYVVKGFLKKFKQNFKTIDPKLWCPKVYLAEVGVFPELSDSVEILLALEDLTPYGYRLGGRSHLTPAEMMLMTKAIAQFHACSYALKIQKDSLIDELKSKIIPLRFKLPNNQRCLYDRMYEIALDRLFDYIDKTPEEIDSPELKRNMELLRQKYDKKGVELMESFLADDPDFSVILHGDYNRNNVLFRYDENSNPIDLRMIDFQETRYGTPAIDLSFYFYMNMNPELMKTNLFDELLQSYHKHLIAALCELLQCKEDDKRLDTYSFANFMKHFKKFAFYGGMVAIQFLPCMNCPADECERLSNLWFTAMDSEEFYHVSMTCGGKPVNQRLMEVVRTATRLGHLDILH